MKAITVGLLVLLSCGLALGTTKQPDVFSMKPSSAHANMLHEHFFGDHDFETGKLHELEGRHYDEKNHIVRWHSSKFRLHSQFMNLDKKDFVKSIKCPPGDETIEITTNTKPTFKQGDMVYFRSKKWTSGCHQHHDNDQDGVNFFELKNVQQPREKENGEWQTISTIRAAGSEEVFEESHFRFYQEDLKTSHSEKMEAYQREKKEKKNLFDRDEEEEESQMEDSQRVHSFRKRNLPEHMRGWISSLRQRVQSASAPFQKRAETFDPTPTPPVPSPTGFTANISNSSLVELALTLDRNFGIVNLAGKLTLTFNFAFELENKKFTLLKFRTEIVAAVGGGVGVTLNLGNLIRDALDLPAAAVTFPIPTPMPGLFITVTPAFRIQIAISANIIFRSQIGQHTAEGELGANLVWNRNDSWHITTIKNFNWRLPSVNDFKKPMGRLALTIAPYFGLELGASAALVVGLGGGPYLAFPLIIAITSSAQCKLNLDVSFKVVLGMGVRFKVLAFTLLSAKWQDPLYNNQLFRKCLLGPVTPPVTPINLLDP